MAPHSSTLAWKILWTEEPGRLQSMGLLRVGHNWATSLSLFTFMHWRRKWQPTPVFLPGESQGWGSLVGWRLWGHTELDTTEVTQQQQLNGSNVWDNDQFILHYDSVAKCSHEYKKPRLRTRILSSCREQWLLKWNPHYFPCCIIFSASPNISFESGIYVCVYGCVCVCVYKKEREGARFYYSKT